MRPVLLALLVFSLTACDDDEPQPQPPPETEPETEPEIEPRPEVEPPEPWTDAWLIAEGERYLTDAEHRRESMTASLRNPENLYSRTRIASYGLGDRGWDRLPEWNPRTRVLTAEDRRLLERGGRPELGHVDRLWNAETPATADAWRALGREVFFRFPLRADRWVEHGLANRERGAELGLVTAPDGTTPGVVVFLDLDRTEQVGITCALCHSTPEGGALVEGLARRSIDYGRLQLDFAEARGSTLPADMAARMASWGPGRADITEDDDEDPVAIPDLWGLRHQSALTQAATIRHIGPVAIALRQETQYLYANHHRARPPRTLMWALTMYLYSLSPPARDAPDVDADALARGRVVFDDQCVECHDNDAGGGDPIRADRVGTDPGLANGVARGTGLYRPAALVRVADAAPYLHHGAVGSLDDLLSARRLEADYQGPLGPGAAPGHRYGLDLPAADQAALLTFLRTL